MPQIRDHRPPVALRLSLLFRRRRRRRRRRRTVFGREAEGAVKEGIDKYSAVLKHPEVAQAEIREATARALKGKGATPYVVKPPISIGIEWNSTTIAQTCGLIPGVKLTSSRSTEYTANDWPDSMKVLLVQLLLALEVSGGKGIYQ